MMIIIFWEMTLCGSYKNRRFGGSYRLHLQGVRCEQTQNEEVSSCICSDSIGISNLHCHHPCLSATDAGNFTQLQLEFLH
jgi:hypothetical protein